MNLIRWILVLALVGVFAYLVIRVFRKGGNKTKGPQPVKDLANLSIVDAQVGDTISLAGVGDDYEDVDFTVERRDRYQSGRDEWYEVSGRYRGRRVFVEWYEDDYLEVSAKLHPTKLGLADLGISEEDLMRMDEEQERSEGFDYDGSTWTYESSEEVGYFKDGVGEGEGFYTWDFREKDGKRILFVEKWEGDPFEVGIALTIHPNDIRVFRT